jgi:hypothetical protein
MGLRKRTKRGRNRLYAANSDRWRDMTDPLNFVVGSLLLLRYDHCRKAWERVAFAVVICVITLSSVVIVVFDSDVDLGDPVWFGVTLFVAGLATLVPGRLAELRQQHRPDLVYPKALRRLMTVFEWLFVLVAITLIAAWGVHFQGGAVGSIDVGGVVPDHRVLRALVLALGITSFADLVTFYGCLITIDEAHKIRLGQTEAENVAASDDSSPGAVEGVPVREVAPRPRRSAGKASPPSGG